MTLRTTGEGGAVAVGVSATREAERASDRDGLSLAMNCVVVKRSPKLLATFAKTEQSRVKTPSNAGLVLSSFAGVFREVCRGRFRPSAT